MTAPHSYRAKDLTADEIRRLRVILRRGITPWMANSLCRLALKGLKATKPRATSGSTK